MPLKNSWLFPVIQSIHLCGIALLVGSIAIADLRLLGYALSRYPIDEITHRFATARVMGMAIILVTGPIMFASDVHRYAHNPAFVIKMAILLIALIFQFKFHARGRKHPKTVAIISLVLWTGVVLGGRAIADFDI